MKRWSTVEQTKKTSPNPHVFLGVLAVLGFSVILIGLASTVLSVTPSPVGHSATEVGAGTFFGTNTDIWTVPGRLTTLNATVQNVLTLGTTATWDVFTDAATSYLGFRSTSAGPTLLAIKPTGEVGIGTTTPSQKLDVVGSAHASTDVCYGDSADGKCLSDLTGVSYVTPSKKMQVVCNPACDYSSSINLDSALFDPDGDNEGTVTVSCPAGTIPFACGGGVKVETASEFLKGYSIVPQYGSTFASPGDSITGCKMDWKTTTSPTPLTVRGFVRAACISLYP